MPVPTVRVEHPLDPKSFMTINMSDLGSEHKLYHEQAEGFVPPSLFPHMSGEEREAIFQIGLETIADSLEMKIDDFRKKVPKDRLVLIQKVVAMGKDAPQPAKAMGKDAPQPAKATGKAR